MNLKKIVAVPVLIVGLLLVVQLSRSIISMHGRGGRVKELAAEVAGLEERKQGLEAGKEFRESLEFVEREARDKLRMVKEGEHILVLPEEQNEKNPNTKHQTPNNEEKANWKKWLDYWLDL